MDPPIIQIPRTGSYNGLIECGGPATRAVVAVEERTSLVSLALRRALYCKVELRCFSHLAHLELTYTHHDVCDRRVYITRMAMVQMLFFLGSAFFAFAKVGAAPAKYDQRQDGEINGHGTLKNLLFVVLFPGNSGSTSTNDISDLAWHAIQAAVNARSKGQGAIKSSEEVRQEEPYSAEIQINENYLDKENSVQKVEGDTKMLNVLDQQLAPIGDEQTKKIDRIARNVKNFDFPKSREVPTLPGYFVNVRKTSRPKTGGSGRVRSVVGNVIWNPDDEPGRPSLKKQLPGEKDVTLFSSNVEKNDVSPLTEEQQQELRLLGDGVENCGPGRHRDASGVCQFDESADSL
ncbi:PREDICTED: uncharacterized protein LOC108685108 [Atta colombica]|uniref:uncharacterized protein LOC108685108 n=1 Tax=Atta colombica TaxID=520822 RepID=UPI00084CA5D6|nr:PREDICTED: uncharacterized protein LOC108685108 [Atta colombica]